MSKHPLLLGLTLLSASLFTGQAFADRTVTDQLGRQVTLPDHVTRVVVLQHQTLYARDRATGDPGRSHPGQY